MAFQKSPAFQFYVNDWLGSTDVSLMTPAEEGGYIHLLCYAWKVETCSLPDNDEVLSKLSRLGDEWFAGAGAKIKACFRISNGKIYHTRLIAERQKQHKWNEKTSRGGQHSAAKKKYLREKVEEDYLQVKEVENKNLVDSMLQVNTEKKPELLEQKINSSTSSSSISSTSSTSSISTAKEITSNKSAGAPPITSEYFQMPAGWRNVGKKEIVPEGYETQKIRGYRYRITNAPRQTSGVKFSGDTYAFVKKIYNEKFEEYNKGMKPTVWTVAHNGNLSQLLRAIHSDLVKHNRYGSEQDVCQFFEMFLNRLPEGWRTKNYSIFSFYRNYDTIKLQMKSTNEKSASYAESEIDHRANLLYGQQ